MKEETKNRLKYTFSIVLVSALVLYVVLAVFVFSDKNETGTCLGIEVVVKDSSDQKFISAADIKRFLNENDMLPTGHEMQSINTTKMERKMMQKLYSIKELECYKTPGNYIRINVTQRTPVVRVMSRAQDYYVDADGKKMAATPYHPAYVLIATGNISEQFATNELYKFATFIKDDAFWNAQIEQIDIDYKEEATLIPRIGRQTIRLGKLDNFEQKLDNLMLLYNDAFDVKGWNVYKDINLKYDNQVVCTKK